MKGIIARTIAVIAAGSMLTMTGAGVAAASVADSAVGKGSSSTIADLAGQLTELRNEVAASIEDVKVSDVAVTADALKSTITGVLEQRSAIPSDATSYAETADSQVTELQGLVDSSAEERLLSLPDPIATVKALLQTLLSTLTGLLDSLLGAAPALPDAGLPGLPDPGLPDPGLPEGDAPDPGLPDPGLPLP